MPITQTPVVIGILATLPALVFWLESTRVGKVVFQFFPPLLFCYFVPSILQLSGIIDAHQTPFYTMATQYFLPASLLLFGLGLDMRALRQVGKPALMVFLAGVFGIVIGAPIALALVGKMFPSVLVGTGSEEIWRGLATVAGTWIGGAANQTAMKEILQTHDTLFALMAVVDVIVAYALMAVLLFCAKRHEAIDKWLGADKQQLEAVRLRLQDYKMSVKKPAEVFDNLLLVAIAFGGVGIAHAVGQSFFWIVFICTTLGLVLSFVPKARALEGVGASGWATVLLYLLITALGTKLDLQGIGKIPLFFLIAFVWVLVHIACLLLMAWWCRAPFFFVAVGSQAAIGGVASAPVVASAFSPHLAPVGVLLAILGYAIGTYCALACAYLMQGVFIWLKF